MTSQIRHGYHQDSEAGVNRSINLVLQASYAYQSVAFYFDRDDMALAKFSKFFHELSKEKREQAEKLLKFQNKRGGHIVLQDVKKPEADEWGTGTNAMEYVLKLEKGVNISLLELHRTARNHTDPHMCDFLEGEFLEEEVKLLKKLGDHITNLKRVNATEIGLGEYLFDRLTLGEDSS